MVQRRPWAAVAKLNGGEVDGMEIHVVLAHELVELDVVLIEPPSLPLWCVVCCDTRVADGCVELMRLSAHAVVDNMFVLTHTSAQVRQRRQGKNTNTTHTAPFPSSRGHLHPPPSARAHPRSSPL